MNLAVRLLATLVILAPSPARADTVGDRNPHEPGVPAVVAPVPSNEPKLTVIPVPIPWLMVGALATYKNFPLFATRNDLELVGGYFWSTDFAYDPASAVAAPPAGMGAGKVNSDRWKATAEWDAHLGGGWTLGPAASFLAGGLATAGAYDPTLIGGASLSGGPLLRYTGLDEVAFPTAGSTMRIGYAYGQHWGAEAFGFHKAGIDAVHYFPLAHNQTVALRGTVQAGWPKLAWIDKYSAGGGDFVRGYQWNRFTGDRLAAAGLEYRNLVLENALGLAGWAKPPVDVGFAVTLHMDAGRVWEARPELGLPLGTDLRAGGGAGIILTLDRAPLGRVEVDGSSEGIFPVAELGTSF